jgi:DNA-binding CsgD family transcriptional regulator
MKRRELLGVVEAAYAPASDRDAWAMAVTRAIAPLYPHEAPPFVVWSSVSSDGQHDVEGIAGIGASPTMLETVRAMSEVATADTVARLWRHHAGVGTVSECLGPLPREPFWNELMQRNHDAGDSIGLYFQGARKRTVTLNVPLPATRTLERRERMRLLRLISHLSLSERLLERNTAPPRAVMRPDGVVVHAEVEASAPSARAALRAQVLRVERARRTEDEDDALGLWRGMVDGQWSLVDEFDSDGKRFFVARENLRELIAPRALTAREGQTLALLCEGKSNKLIAYELGLSPATVSMIVRSILEKLGVKHRAELIDLATSLGAFGGGHAK